MKKFPVKLPTVRRECKEKVLLLPTMAEKKCKHDDINQDGHGCCFLVQAMLPDGFPFHQFNMNFVLLNQSSI